MEANLQGDEEENGDRRIFTSWRLVQENGLFGLLGGRLKMGGRDRGRGSQSGALWFLKGRGGCGFFCFKRENRGGDESNG